VESPPRTVARLAAIERRLRTELEIERGSHQADVSRLEAEIELRAGGSSRAIGRRGSSAVSSRRYAGSARARFATGSREGIDERLQAGDLLKARLRL
jgi:hypothetical protein